MGVSMQTHAADIKTYGVDYFPNEYAQGSLNIEWDENSKFYGYNIAKEFAYDDITTPNGTEYYYSNKSKDNSVYIYLKDVVLYKGKTYDVKVYTWSTMPYYMVRQSAYGLIWFAHPSNNNTVPGIDYSTGMPAAKDCKIYIQIEIQGLSSFKGVSSFLDLDNEEAWSCDEIVSWYKHSGTNLTISENKVTGTTDNDSTENTHFTISTTNGNLNFVYYCNIWYGGRIATADTNITYKIADNSEYGAGETLFTTGVSYYSNYNVLQTDDIEGLQKTVTEGNRTYNLKEQWYSDANTTAESPSSVKIVTSPLTLYGTYYKCWNIDTYIQNGQITASEYGIDPGESRTVSWQAGPGYYVESVMIDGKSISIDDKNGGSYTFNDISSDHDVSVICEVAGTEITLTKTIAVDDIDYEHGNPTFLFKVDGTDVFGDTHTYYQSTEFDKTYVDQNSYTGSDGKTYVDQTVYFNLWRGNYTVSEVGVSRYATDTVSNIKSGTAKDGTAVFDLTDSGSGSAAFTNAHTTYEHDSHNAVIINHISANREQ